MCFFRAALTAAFSGAMLVSLACSPKSEPANGTIYPNSSVMRDSYAVLFARLDGLRSALKPAQTECLLEVEQEILQRDFNEMNGVTFLAHEYSTNWEKHAAADQQSYRKQGLEYLRQFKAKDFLAQFRPQARDGPCLRDYCTARDAFGRALEEFKKSVP